MAEAEAEAEAEAQGSGLRAQGSGLRAQGSGLIRIRAQESGLASSTCVRGALARWSTVGTCGAEAGIRARSQEIISRPPGVRAAFGVWAGASQCRESEGERERGDGETMAAQPTQAEGPVTAFKVTTAVVVSAVVLPQLNNDGIAPSPRKCPNISLAAVQILRCKTKKPTNYVVAAQMPKYITGCSVDFTLQDKFGIHGT